MSIKSERDTTPNYGLVKPKQTDFYNVNDFNENMTKIDGQIKVNADGVKENSTQIKSLSDKVENIDVSWNGITGKPVTFPPNTHVHTKAQITDFPTSLPASGGNADTVDGKHATDFKSSTWMPTKEDIGLGNVPNYGASTSVSSTSTTTLATSSAVKLAYDKAQEALNMAKGIGLVPSNTARVNVISSIQSENAAKSKFIGEYVPKANGVVQVKATLYCSNSVNKATLCISAEAYNSIYNVAPSPKMRSIQTMSLALGASSTINLDGYTQVVGGSVQSTAPTTVGAYVEVTEGVPVRFFLGCSSNAATAYCSSLQICYDEVNL